MENTKIYNCKYCKYTSNRNFNLKQHEINKHYKEILKNENTISNEKNTISNEKNTISNEKNTISHEKNTISNEKKELFCKKCNKIYKTKKSLIEHEEKCKGINSLTCPTCMISFTTSGNKSRHIKRNNCKPKSIINAINNNTTNNNINNITNNNCNNTINNNITNNYYINNYGSERVDYLTDDVVFNIIIKDDSVKNLVIIKHFNKDFPENNNIKYDDNLNIYLIKENNEWNKANSSFIYDKLIFDTSNYLLSLFYYKGKELDNFIKNEEIYNYKQNDFLLLKNKNDKIKKNNLVKDLKYIIINYKN